jgi:ornithine decarboxylase
MNDRIAQFLAEKRPDTPCLIVDTQVVEANYRRLCAALPQAEIYYAVKANPAIEVLRVLVGLGSRFDAASVYEIERCLAAGARAETVSYGNTIKKQADIARAFALGVRMYAFDSEAELAKLAAEAPGAGVFCRILVPEEGACWPMARKFGCEAGMARDLLVDARDMGLTPHGVSFHIGSQQTDPSRWDVAIARTAMLFTALNEAGVELKAINLGGGFPLRYRGEIPEIEAYADSIMESISRHFGNRIPDLAVEPGRVLAGDAGVIQSEVVLISRKSQEDERRWVYLDIGKFGGLAETEGERIQYRIRTPKDGGKTGPVVLAGPTCDGTDILYEASGYELPLDLEIGDRIEILDAGAYTETYASVGFNGIPPLNSYYL